MHAAGGSGGLRLSASYLLDQRLLEIDLGKELEVDRPMETSGGPNSPDRSSNSPEFSTGAGARGSSGSDFDPGEHRQASPPRPVLGPDGRRADETWSESRSGLSALVERNPVIAAFASLGVGLAVGIIVGAAIARD